MFPAKVVGIIGNQGKMARNIYEPLFREAGLEVIGSDISDPDGLSNAEVIAKSDVVIFSILPLADVAPTMRRLVVHACPNTLWLHGSSIQQVRDFPIGNVLEWQTLKVFRVDTGFVHFMIAPNVRSLHGQSIVFGFPQELLNPRWKTWMVNLLEAKKAKLAERTIAEHDALTKGSQLLPMILAVAVGMVWQRSNIDVTQMLKVAGAPAKLQAFGAIRSLGQQDVVSEIITSHPDGPKLVDTLADVFADLSQMIKNGNTAQIAAEMKRSREMIEKETLDKVLAISDWLVRVLGDLNGGAVGFEFSEPENIVGLLAQVLGCFDKHEVDKTTTMAQTILPSGVAQFFIGVTPDLDDPRVKAANAEVLSMPGANTLEDRFTI